MIGKHVPNPKKRSSFRALNDYITGKGKRRLEDRDEKIAYSDSLNLLSVDTATTEMESLAFQNKRCKDPVMHLLLSWRENETPTREQVLEAVRITLDELNLSQCQTLYSLHQNTDNLHLHICVNRIDPDTHKAITPAGGWTRRAMEHAARRIESTQGWQVEANTWSEINDQNEVVQKPQSSEIKIPQPVKDKENLTGEQSAARKAQEALKDTKFMDISSWEELHALMNENGMEYRKQGSGAVIQVGEVTIKASAASRNLTLSKLEKQFGVYQSPVCDRQTNKAAMEKIASPQPLAPENDGDKWKEFIAARNEHFKNKRQTREELIMSHRKEQLALKERHRAERAELFRSLGGRGLGRRHINCQSSLLAARHAAEMAIMKEEQQSQREKQQCTFVSFRSYENWLKSRGLAAEADAWRHRRNNTFLELHTPDDVPGNEGKRQQGILGFRAAVTGQGVKFYRDGEKQASLVDMGKRIRLYRQDDETLLAALQLAQEKWGGVQLNGGEEYKRRCTEIAAKNGIRIANPELQEMIAAATETPEEKARRMEETSKILRQKAMELAEKHIPQGVILMTDAQEGRTYSGPVIGIVSHEGRSFALQKMSENQVIRHRVGVDEMERLEQTVGRDVTISYRDGRSVQIENSVNLQKQRSAGRGR